MNQKVRVAIIVNCYRDFRNWVSENGTHSEVYIFVNRLSDVKGRVFNKVEKLFSYRRVQDIDEILEYLESHTK